MLPQEIIFIALISFFFKNIIISHEHKNFQGENRKKAEENPEPKRILSGQLKINILKRRLNIRQKQQMIAKYEEY